MRFRRTERFRKSFESLPDQIRRTAGKQFGLFSEDPSHPSLRSKPILPHKHYWEISVTMQYRIIWRYDEDDRDLVILYDIGARGRVRGRQGRQ